MITSAAKARWTRLLIGALLAVAASCVLAEGLTYRIEGVGRELRENIIAHLGEPPADELAAERFLVTAPGRAVEALEALGYYDAVIEIEVDRARSPWLATLFVKVDEPLRYTSVSVALSGPGEEDAALQRLLVKRAPKVGEILHHGRYAAFRDDLQQLARQRGFFDANLEAHEILVDASERAVELTFHFTTGPRYRFGEIRADDELLDEGFLRSLRAFEVGEPYTQEGILRLRQRLLRLGYFSSVVVVPQVPERSEGRVPVRVDVLRAPRHSYELGVGFSTDTRQRFSLVWRTPRINRFGHSQQTSLRWSPVNPEFRITYNIPLDDPSRDLLQIITRLEGNEYGDLNSDQRELAIRREVSTGVGVLSGGGRALNEEWDVLNESFSSDFLLATLTYSRRRRGEAPVDPQSGFSQYYELEMAGEPLGSSASLLRAYGQWVSVKRFAQDWRVVARGELGLLWSSTQRPDEIPPSLTFFAGGDTSIRGYGYQSIGRDLLSDSLAHNEGDSGDAGMLTVGGTRLATASLEVQRYLSPTWRLALFSDVGDAFVDADFDANVGLGLGVHYLSPVGALRFEVASPVTADSGDWRIHINIGAEF